MSILHLSIMVNNSHNAPIDVSDIIKQLVRGYKGKVEKLLPIRGISEGFKSGKNIQKFKLIDSWIVRQYENAAVAERPGGVLALGFKNTGQLEQVLKSVPK